MQLHISLSIVPICTYTRNKFARNPSNVVGANYNKLLCNHHHMYILSTLVFLVHFECWIVIILFLIHSIFDQSFNYTHTHTP